MGKHEPTQEWVEVIFRGPTHFLEAFGQTVRRGQSAVFHAAEAFALTHEPFIDVEVVGPAEAAAVSESGGEEPSEPEAGDGEGHDETHENKEG